MQELMVRFAPESRRFLDNAWLWQQFELLDGHVDIVFLSERGRAVRDEHSVRVSVCAYERCDVVWVVRSVLNGKRYG